MAASSVEGMSKEKQKAMQQRHQEMRRWQQRDQEQLPRPQLFGPPIQVKRDDPLHQQCNMVLGRFEQVKDLVRHPSIVGVCNEPNTPLSPVPGSSLFPDPPKKEAEDPKPSPLVQTPNGMHKASKVSKAESNKHDKGAFQMLEDMKHSSTVDAEVAAVKVENNSTAKKPKDTPGSSSSSTSSSKHRKKSRSSSGRELPHSERHNSSSTERDGHRRSKSGHGVPSSSKRSSSSSSSHEGASANQNEDSQSQRGKRSDERNPTGEAERPDHTDVFSSPKSKSQASSSHKKSQQRAPPNGLLVNGLNKEHTAKLEKLPALPKLIIQPKIQGPAVVESSIDDVLKEMSLHPPLTGIQTPKKDDMSKFPFPAAPKSGKQDLASSHQSSLSAAAKSKPRDRTSSRDRSSSTAEGSTSLETDLYLSGDSDAEGDQGGSGSRRHSQSSTNNNNNNSRVHKMSISSAQDSSAQDTSDSSSSDSDDVSSSEEEEEEVRVQQPTPSPPAKVKEADVAKHKGSKKVEETKKPTNTWQLAAFFPTGRDSILPTVGSTTPQPILSTAKKKNDEDSCGFDAGFNALMNDNVFGKKLSPLHDSGLDTIMYEHVAESRSATKMIQNLLQKGRVDSAQPTTASSSSSKRAKDSAKVSKDGAGSGVVKSPKGGSSGRSAGTAGKSPGRRPRGRGAGHVASKPQASANASARASASATVASKPLQSTSSDLKGTSQLVRTSSAATPSSSGTSSGSSQTKTKPTLAVKPLKATLTPKAPSPKTPPPSSKPRPRKAKAKSPKSVEYLPSDSESSSDDSSDDQMIDVVTISSPEKERGMVVPASNSRRNDSGGHMKVKGSKGGSTGKTKGKSPRTAAFVSPHQTASSSSSTVPSSFSALANSATSTAVTDSSSLDLKAVLDDVVSAPLLSPIPHAEQQVTRPAPAAAAAGAAAGISLAGASLTGASPGLSYIEGRPCVMVHIDLKLLDTKYSQLHSAVAAAATVTVDAAVTPSNEVVEEEEEEEEEVEEDMEQSDEEEEEEVQQEEAEEEEEAEDGEEEEVDDGAEEEEEEEEEEEDDSDEEEEEGEWKPDSPVPVQDQADTFSSTQVPSIECKSEPELSATEAAMDSQTELDASKANEATDPAPDEQPKAQTSADIYAQMQITKKAPSSIKIPKRKKGDQDYGKVDPKRSRTDPKRTPQDHDREPVSHEDDREWDMKHPHRIEGRYTPNSTASPSSRHSDRDSRGDSRRVQRDRDRDRDRDRERERERRRSRDQERERERERARHRGYTSRDLDDPNANGGEDDMSPPSLCGSQGSTQDIGSVWGDIARGHSNPAPLPPTYERRYPEEVEPVPHHYSRPRHRVAPVNDRIESADYYLTEAKKIKHLADKMKMGNKLIKSLTYIEAVLAFIQHGYAMEHENVTDAGKISRMYHETLKLLKYICSSKGSHEPCDAQDKEKEKRLTVLSLRIQSLLCLKLFKYKQSEAVKLKKAIDDYYKSSSSHQTTPAQAGTSSTPTPSSWNGRTMGTPSPMSPQPSPGGSVSSVGSGNADLGPPKLNGSGGGLSAPATVPQRIHSITSKYFDNVDHLFQCHVIWDQACDLAQEHKDFFKELDQDCGQLTMQSSVPEFVRYIKEGLHRLKTT